MFWITKIIHKNNILVIYIIFNEPILSNYCAPNLINALPAFSYLSFKTLL